MTNASNIQKRMLITIRGTAPEMKAVSRKSERPSSQQKRIKLIVRRRRINTTLNEVKIEPTKRSDAKIASISTLAPKRRSTTCVKGMIVA